MFAALEAAVSKSNQTQGLIGDCITIDSSSDWFPARMGLLSEIGTKIQSLPLNVLLVGHSLYVAYLFHHLREKYLLSYWVGLMAAVGGGVVSAYLIGDSKLVSNPLFTIDSLYFVWSICWWLVNYFPTGIVASVVGIAPIKAACKVCTTILKGSTMASRIDVASKLYKGNWAAALILGTVGATGGKFLSDALLSLTEMQAGPVELLTPGFAWRSGALGSMTYFLLVHVWQYLTPQEGRALVCSILIAHSILSDVFKVPLDFTEPISRILHAVLNVPNPAVRKASKTDKAAKLKAR